MPLITIGLTFITSVLGWVLIRLGVGLVSFAGFSTLLGVGMQAVKTNVAGLPASTVQLLGLCGFDRAISVVLSAYAVNVALMVVSRWRGR
jgi:tartrate dehydratase alpha subunit/fumarate hydratase class I-like protein